MVDREGMHQHIPKMNSSLNKIHLFSWVSHNLKFNFSLKLQSVNELFSMEWNSLKYFSEFFQVISFSRSNISFDKSEKKNVSNQQW